MCKVLETSKSGYYNWLSTVPSKLWPENQEIMDSIHSIFEDSHQSYGSPRMAIELEKRGFKVSRQRAVRIMKASGLQARRKRKFKHTTDSNQSYPIAPNRLNRNFTTADRMKCGCQISPILRPQKDGYILR
ncbi:MAG: IS3 family transposase [Crocinitomicaceae bacterium]